MAKRARLMTVEDVLDLDDDYANFDEPMMPGSNDEFDAIDLEEESDSDSHEQGPPLSPTQQVSSATATLPTDWCSNLTPPTIGYSTSPVGPTVPIPEKASKVFDLMFTPTIMDTMVEQSNLYAQQVIGEKYGSWKKITMEELRAYFGFCILMGVAHLPAPDDYWSTDPSLQHSPIADRISRNHFQDITRYLRFVDNTTLPEQGSPGYDHLGKVRPVIRAMGYKHL